MLGQTPKFDATMVEKSPGKIQVQEPPDTITNQPTRQLKMKQATTQRKEKRTCLQLWRWGLGPR